MKKKFPPRISAARGGPPPCYAPPCYDAELLQWADVQNHIKGIDSIHKHYAHYYTLLSYTSEYWVISERLLRKQGIEELNSFDVTMPSSVTIMRLTVTIMRLTVTIMRLTVIIMRLTVTIMRLTVLIEIIAIIWKFKKF